MSSVANKLANAAERDSSEAQALISDIRKALVEIRSVAIEFEKNGNSDKVQRLEKAALELITSYEDCASFAQAIREVPRVYQLSNQRTDFKKLIDGRLARLRGPHRRYRTIHSFGSSGRLFGMFTMLANQCLPVIQLTDPVRCVDCRHIYDKVPIMHYIRTKISPKCPIAGCPKVLQVGRVICDSLLHVEIEELRSSGPSALNATNIEDFTDLGDDDNNE
ncbi:hypothetical protein GUJ93_ZPchr0010g11253 [Zizania palustris]|uniref:SP-RING-type domain-containing protein n=1 Tax=Zizania palustris TaxID=103762 RepID=A0A8J5WAM9_ZIZPA|nr:hypothetical protein GUJ93_ZPchr0010g11253 [Zizania palustris]